LTQNVSAEMQTDEQIQRKAEREANLDDLLRERRAQLLGVATGWSDKIRGSV
jgi:hypothetical protein